MRAAGHLCVVQTTILANAIDLASNPVRAKTYRNMIAATEVAFTMCEAVWASERIPEDMELADAVDDFCSYMLKNLRDEDERDSGQPMKLPHWFARAMPSGTSDQKP